MSLNTPKIKGYYIQLYKNSILSKSIGYTTIDKFRQVIK